MCLPGQRSRARGQGQLTMGGGTWRPALRCGIHEPPVGPGGQGQPSLGLNPTHRPGPALRACWAPIQLNQRCQAGLAVSAPGQSMEQGAWGWLPSGMLEWPALSLDTCNRGDLENSLGLLRLTKSNTPARAGLRGQAPG